MMAPVGVWDADAVVVGAGGGGLMAAAVLANAGMRVVVLDRHSVVGGNMSSFCHKGYEFDVGVHYLGACGPGGMLRELLDPLGVKPNFLPMDSDGYDTILIGEQEFRIPAGLERYRERLHARFPAERAGVDAYLRTMATLSDSLLGLRLRPSAAELVRLPRTVWPLLRRGRSSLQALFDRLELSPMLRAVVAGTSGDYGLPPSRASVTMHAAVTMHYMDGAWYPEGGGQVISEALADIVRKNGGDVLLQTPVSGITVSRGRATGVRTRSPQRRGAPAEVRAPIVVSNADLKRTFAELLPEGTLPDRVSRRVAAMTMAPPLFSLFLVLDRDLAAEGFRNTNTWLHPNADIEGSFTALNGHLPERPLVYVSPGSLKDPANQRMCRPGQSNLQLLTFVPGDHSFWGLTDGMNRYRHNDTYQRRKRQIRDAVLRETDRLIPGIRDSIVFEEAATPITHSRFTWSSGGTGYGLAATPEQYLLRRPMPTTPVKGCYVVGASTVFGMGVAGVLAGGRQTADLILARHG
jgi:all-trans-retinol 13,14-reductase